MLPIAPHPGVLVPPGQGLGVPCCHHQGQLLLLLRADGDKLLVHGVGVLCVMSN